MEFSCKRPVVFVLSNLQTKASASSGSECKLFYMTVPVEYIFREYIKRIISNYEILYSFQL